MNRERKKWLLVILMSFSVFGIFENIDLMPLFTKLLCALPLEKFQQFG
jgi:hypothetical protein